MKVGDLEHFKNMSFLAHSARGALRIVLFLHSLYFYISYDLDVFFVDLMDCFLINFDLFKSFSGKIEFSITCGCTSVDQL